MRYLDQFKEQHPGIRASGKSLVVHLVGHSLGGFLAEAVCVNRAHDLLALGWKVRCTTFESTGLPPSYADKALQRHPEPFWQEMMCTYLAAPNPFNMLHKHLGSIVHVKIPFDNSLAHMTGAVVSDALRTAGFVWVGAQLALVAYGAVAGTAAAAAGEAAAATAGSTWWATSTALGFVAQILGVEARELLDQHNCENMLLCFDKLTEELDPRYQVDMVSWPEASANFREEMLGLARRLGGSLLPSYINPCSFGIWNICSRDDVIRARCEQLPGFVPVKSAREEEEEAELRRRSEAAMAATSQEELQELQEALSTSSVEADAPPLSAARLLAVASRLHRTRAAACRWRAAAGKHKAGLPALPARPPLVRSLGSRWGVPA
jgi:hypothetical protein